MGLCCGRNTEGLKKDESACEEKEDDEQEEDDNDEEEEVNEEEESNEIEDNIKKEPIVTEKKKEEVKENESIKEEENKQNENEHDEIDNNDEDIDNETNNEIEEEDNIITNKNKSNKSLPITSNEDKKSKDGSSTKKNSTLSITANITINNTVINQINSNIENQTIQSKKVNIEPKSNASLYFIIQSFILTDLEIIKKHTPLPEIVIQYYNPHTKKIITRRSYCLQTSTLHRTMMNYKNTASLSNLLNPITFKISKSNIIDFPIDLNDQMITNKLITIRVLNSKRKNNPIILGEAYFPFTFIINEDDYNIKIPISVNIEKKVGYLTMSISKSNQRIKSNDYEEFDLTTKYLLSKYTELDYEMCDYFSKTQNKSENKITEIEWRSSLLSKNMLSLIKQIENSNIKKKKKFLYDISQNNETFKKAIINFEEPLQYAAIIFYIKEIRASYNNNEKLSKTVESITEFLFFDKAIVFLEYPNRLYIYYNYLLIRTYFYLLLLIMKYYISTDYLTVKENISCTFNNELVLKNLINNINIISGIKNPLYDQRQQLIQVLELVLSIIDKMLITKFSEEKAIPLEQRKLRFSRVYNNAVTIFQQIDIFIDLCNNSYINSNSEIIELLIVIINKTISLIGDYSNNYYNIEDRPKIVISSIVNKFINEIKYNKFVLFLKQLFISYYHHSVIFYNLLSIVIHLCNQFGKNSKFYLTRKIFSFVTIDIILSHFNLYRNKTDGINKDINMKLYELLMYFTDMIKNYLIDKSNNCEITLTKLEVESIINELSLSFTSDSQILDRKINYTGITFLSSIGASLSRNAEVSIQIWNRSSFYQNVLLFFFSLSKEEIIKTINSNHMNQEETIKMFEEIYIHCMIMLNNLLIKNGDKGKKKILDFYSKKKISSMMIKSKLNDVIHICFPLYNYSNKELCTVSESLILCLDE